MKNQTPSGGVTRLLAAWSGGDRAALDEMIPLVQRELRRLAARHLARERPGHTWAPTDLVQEAYIRLVGERNMHWQNRAHFFAVAAQLMRFILVDHARRKNSSKRGSGVARVSIDQALDIPMAQGADAGLLELDEALEELAVLYPRKARVAELRIFSGSSVEEIAEALQVSAVTVMRDWRLAKAWLQRALSSQTPTQTDRSGGR